MLVSQSAVGYYGDHGEAIVDEATAPGDGFLSQLVVDWEAAAREAEDAGIRVAIIRTGLVLDPEGGLLKQLLPVFKLGVGGPLAGGAQYMPWIHRDDEIGLLLWALDNERVTGTLNACAPNPVTNREFSKTLGKRPPPPRGRPGAEARRARDARRGADREHRRLAAGRSPAARSTSATSSAGPSSSRRCATCCAADPPRGRYSNSISPTSSTQ